MLVGNPPKLYNHTVGIALSFNKKLVPCALSSESYDGMQMVNFQLILFTH